MKTLQYLFIYLFICLMQLLNLLSSIQRYSFLYDAIDKALFTGFSVISLFPILANIPPSISVLVFLTLFFQRLWNETLISLKLYPLLSSISKPCKLHFHHFVCLYWFLFYPFWRLVMSVAGNQFLWLMILFYSSILGSRFQISSFSLLTSTSYFNSYLSGF